MATEDTREQEYGDDAERKELMEKHAAMLNAIRYGDPRNPDAEPVPSVQSIEAAWHKWSWRIHKALRVYCAWCDWHGLPDGERTHLKLHDMLLGAEREITTRGQ